MKASRSRSDPQKTLVGFMVGELQYALDITHVVQIVNPLEISPLPHLEGCVVGVCDYRGEVLPVIDMRVRYGLATAAVTRRTKWIITRVAGRQVALVVDAVTEVFGTAGAQLRPAPPLSGDDLRGIKGVAQNGKALAFVVDVSALAPLVERMSPLSKASELPVGGRP